MAYMTRLGLPKARHAAPDQGEMMQVGLRL
jgi:hypothetical protein